jgi:hypothetical protein
MLTRLFVVVGLSTLAHAAQVVHSVQLPLQPLPINTQVVLPRFDPAIGVLTQVRLGASVYIAGSVRMENTFSQRFSGPVRIFADLSVTGTQGALLNGNQGNFTVGTMLGAFDGVIDWGGNSGTTYLLASTFGAGADSFFTYPPDLDGFTGTGTVTLGVASAAHASSNPDSLTYDFSGVGGQVVVSVFYDYSNFPSYFCRPLQFSGGLCPCSNFGGYACGNSANTAGAGLSSIGTPSLSSDNFVLMLQGTPPNASLLFFQGTSSTFNGSAFGDGVRCVVGTVVRLGNTAASGGMAHYPGAGDAPISVKGMIPGPGVYRAYQAWYRDVASYCTPALFNISSAVGIAWMP